MCDDNDDLIDDVDEGYEDEEDLVENNSGNDTNKKLATRRKLELLQEQKALKEQLGEEWDDLLE